MQREDSAKARAGWVAALAPALKVKPGAFGFMGARGASTPRPEVNGAEGGGSNPGTYAVLKLSRSYKNHPLLTNHTQHRYTPRDKSASCV